MTPDTGLVSLMLVNNELGTLTDVGAIAQIVHAAGALFHVDDAPACNPCQLTRAQGSKLSAKVSADGFADAEVTLDFDAARLVTLIRRAAPPSRSA